MAPAMIALISSNTSTPLFAIKLIRHSQATVINMWIMQQMHTQKHRQAVHIIHLVANYLLHIIFSTPSISVEATIKADTSL